VVNGVTFFVAGVPVPQGSKTAYVVGKRAVLTDANKTVLKPWRAEVTRVARASWADRARLVDVAVQVVATFVFERPKSVKRPVPSVKPDVDKLARALLDGVTDAGVWKDDSQVTDLRVEKVYGAAPGVHVVISRADEPLAGEEKAA
jgi:Holliday junction resolvase RusA-like endonuclease